jgi:hypothetical protein
MTSAAGRWVTVQDSEGHEVGKFSVDALGDQRMENARQ